MTPTVAIVAMGEMGAGVAGRLVQRGARVVTVLAGRSPASAKRAEAAGVDVVADDAALVGGADILLSIVPPANAAEVAQGLLPSIRSARPDLIYADCNAVAPETAMSIAEPFIEAGLRFVDAGIIGQPPGANGSTPRIYASGRDAEALTCLNAYGLDIEALSPTIGHASALKMAYAGTTKGIQAVLMSMMLGAMRAGVGEAFVREMHERHEGRLEEAVRRIPMVLTKAYRWDAEMEEIARFLLPEPGGAQIFEGAAAFYRALAADALDAGSERAELLSRYLTAGK